MDIKELTIDSIAEVNEEKWILSKRHKTKVNFQVKLLDIPLQIIKRYERFQEERIRVLHPELQVHLQVVETDNKGVRNYQEYLISRKSPWIRNAALSKGVLSKV